MSKHVWERSRIQPNSVLHLMTTYCLNRVKLGDELAKRYAVFYFESCQQTSSPQCLRVASERQKAYKTRPVYSAEVFDRLLQDAPYGPFPLPPLDAIRKTTLKDPGPEILKKGKGAYSTQYYGRFIAYKKKMKLLCAKVIERKFHASVKAQKKLQRMKQALVNFKNIMGYDWRFFKYNNDEDPVFGRCGALMSWASVRRGRDLFLKGLGSFDITQTLTHRRNLSESVTRVRAEGYFPDSAYYAEHIFSEPVLREYLFKHWNYYRVNRNTLDELFRIPRDELDHLRPQEIHQRIEEAEAQRRLQESIPLDFSWLDNPPIVKTPHGVLKPLQSEEEIEEVSEKLDNCASGYTRQVGRKLCLLVCLFKDLEPYCLGLLNPKRGWTQILLASNKKPPDGVKDQFLNNTNTFSRLFS